MLFSGTIALFTGMLSMIPIQDQTNTNLCVSYAISHCTGISTGNIWSEIQSYGALPSLVYRDHGVRYLQNNYQIYSLYNSGEIKSSIDKGKYIIGFMNGFERNIYAWKTPRGLVSQYIYRVKRISTDNINGHAICIVGYNDEGIVFANSYGKIFGEDGYGLIKRKDAENNNYFYSITTKK